MYINFFKDVLNPMPNNGSKLSGQCVWPNSMLVGHSQYLVGH